MSAKPAPLLRDEEQQQQHRSSARPSPALQTVKLPGGSSASSRPASPARLRSRASVAVSNIDVHSDNLVRLEEDLAYLSERLLENGDEDVGTSKEVRLPVSMLRHAHSMLADAFEQTSQPVRTCDYADQPLIEAGISDYTFIPVEQGGLLGRGKFSSVQLAWKNGKKVGYCLGIANQEERDI